MIFNPITWSVIAGLVVGKFLGIAGASWLAVKTKIAKLPACMTWHHLLGAA